jgi:hypothetical protein
MNEEFSMYRIRVRFDQTGRLWDILGAFRPGQYKIQGIDPRYDHVLVNIIVTTEELNFLSLTFANLQPFWLQDWTYETT